MRKNDEIILNITDVTNEGSGIGKYEGMAVFVPMTAVGDKTLVRILKVKKTYAYGKAMEILEPANCRIEPDCPVFSKCGGCVYRHIDYKAEVKLKEQKVYECIKRIGGIDLIPQPILYGESAECYRNKAQYPVSDEGKAGFYAFHSHRIIPASGCLLQPEIFSRITALCERWIKEKNISIYDESTHKGLLRHIYLRIGEKTGEIMVTLVINGDTINYTEELIFELKELCGENLKSVQLNINKENTNVILGKKCVVLYGDAYITDILCGVKVRLSPLSFYQVNRTMAERLYLKAREYAEPECKNILDLYCGAGTIGLSMADKAKSIIGVEIIPEAVKDAEFNAENNGIKNAKFICADATAAAEKLKEEKISADAVILDPPRKGCTPELIKTVAKDFNPERVVYVSCDPATLARDIKIFFEFGYSLKEYTPVDLFARTSHVETVALLSRKINVHNMKLNSSPFEMIKSGQKTIELRLFDEKRQQVKVGDKIVFTNTTTGETLNTTVVKLHRFDSFDELYKSLPLLKCGYTSEDVDKAHPSDLEQYYSVEERKKYGVVGIEISRPKKLQTSAAHGLAAQ